MTKGELVPCPFCGESAELHALDMDYATYGVECSCGASLTVAGSPVDAISAWNRRTSAPMTKGELVERLLSRADTMNGTRVGAGDGDTYTLGYYSKMDAALDREAATALSEQAARIEELEEALRHRRRLSDLLRRARSKRP